MRVFILGAGFSREAGYPLASELLPEVAKLWTDSLVDDQSARWRHLEDWRSRQLRRGHGIRDVIANANPEYLLTYLDIACGACRSASDAMWADAVRADRNETVDADELIRKANKAHVILEPEDTHRRTLQDAVMSFFRYRHYYDLGMEEKWVDGRVMAFFRDHVAAGDTVVTFNYDAVAERCLHALGKWHPSDGYGFRVQLSPAQGSPPTEGSPVRVLKLHGSVGWHRCRESGADGIMLDTAFTTGLGLYDIQDTRTVNRTWARQEDCLIFPSFVKVLDHGMLASIWAEAAKALSHADEVIILGYSLPQADSAAVSLLAASLSHTDTPVTVVDPQHEVSVWDHYAPVLNRPPKHLRMTLSKWVEDAI